MPQNNLEFVENQIEKIYQKKDRQKKSKMKVSGKEVLKLKKIMTNRPSNLKN
jgi:hypothetical protein